MKFLLDTHVLLWYLAGAKALTPGTRDLVRDPLHQVFVLPRHLKAGPPFSRHNQST